MARDDLFRRSFEAGTAFLDMTREKAEALVKDLVKAGEVKKGKASKLIEEVLERSRRGTEELVSLIRREIGEQVAALGLATKDDLARLEARLEGASEEIVASHRRRLPAGLAAAGPGTLAAR
jgi:polyhydroxyalkanoate synthesis regulator phasin